MSLLLAVQNTSPKEQIVFRNTIAVQEHKITTGSTVVSDLFPWSCAHPHSKGKRGMLRWTKNMGVQITALPLLSQETHGHSIWAISEEFNEVTVYSGAGREQGIQQSLNYQVIPSLEIAERGHSTTSGPEGMMWGAVPRIQKANRSCGPW